VFSPESMPPPLALLVSAMHLRIFTPLRMRAVAAMVSKGYLAFASCRTGGIILREQGTKPTDSVVSNGREASSGLLQLPRKGIPGAAGAGSTYPYRQHRSVTGVAGTGALHAGSVNRCSSSSPVPEVEVEVDSDDTDAEADTKAEVGLPGEAGVSCSQSRVGDKCVGKLERNKVRDERDE